MSGRSNLKAKHVVLDSNAFIRNVDVTAFGQVFYTVPDVVAEIRDQQTRDRLQVLPYKLEMRTPAPQSLQEVADFAKKTGDYQVLSVADLKVIALTLELHRQHNCEELLRNAPKRAELHDTAELVSEDKNSKLPPGWYVPKENESSDWNDEGCVEHDDEGEEDAEAEGEAEDNQNDAEEETDPESAWITLQNIDSLKQAFNSLTVSGETKTGPTDAQAEHSDASGSDSDEADSGQQDPEGNDKINSEVKNPDQEQVLPTTQETVLPVVCMTGDYAMQNVMLQIGLRVFGVTDGQLSVIRETRNYVLRCTACSCVTTDMSKRFCPDCGNHSTLRRVVKKVAEDGKVELFIATHRPLNARGLRYSLPVPRGGKHNVNPILSADQPRAQERAARRAKQRMDALAFDYGAANDNPFNMHDLHSRAARHGVTRRQDEDGSHLLPSRRRNPNEGRKRRK